MHDKMVRNSLSRLDNKTYICNGCGRDEAIFNLYNPANLLTPVNMRVFPGEKTGPDDIKNPKTDKIEQAVEHFTPKNPLAGQISCLRDDIAIVAETLGEEQDLIKTYGEKIAEREAQAMRETFGQMGLEFE